MRKKVKQKLDWYFYDAFFNYYPDSAIGNFVIGILVLLYVYKTQKERVPTERILYLVWSEILTVQYNIQLIKPFENSEL